MKKKGLIIGITVAVYLIFRYLLSLVIPFLIVFLFYEGLKKPVDVLAAKTHWKKEIWAVLLLIGIGGGIAGAGFLLYKAGCAQIGNLGDTISKYQSACGKLVCSCCERLEPVIGIQAKKIEASFHKNMMEISGKITDNLIPNMVVYSAQCFQKAAGWFGKAFLVLVMTVLLLKDDQWIQEMCREHSTWQKAADAGMRLKEMLLLYLKGECRIIAWVSAACTTGLGILGVSGFWLLGPLIGILDALPLIGTGIFLVPWAVLKLILRDYVTGVGLFLLFLAANAVREYLAPKVMGERFGISPFFFAAAVYVGIFLFGIGGVILGPVGLLVILQLLRICA